MELNSDFKLSRTPEKKDKNKIIIESKALKTNSTC